MINPRILRLVVEVLPLFDIAWGAEVAPVEADSFPPSISAVLTEAFGMIFYCCVVWVLTGSGRSISARTLDWLTLLKRNEPPSARTRR